MFEHIAMFIVLVECKSFSKASDELRLSQSSISRKLTELEQHVGKILIIRDTRNMRLTDCGVLLYNKFKHIRKDFHNYLLEINSSKNIVSGDKLILNICLHSTTSYELICPHLKHYAKQFPHVDLNIVFYTIDYLIGEINFDIGITHRMIQPAEYVVKPIRNDSLKLFCTPRYVRLNGFPNHINELGKHNVIGGLDNFCNDVNIIKSIILVNKYSKENFLYKIDNASINTNSALHSKKIGMSMDRIFWSWESLCKNDVVNGTLIPVLPEYEILKNNVFYLVYRNNLSYEGAMFCELLYKCMEGQ